jgi:hypothetical protein
MKYPTTAFAPITMDQNHQIPHPDLALQHYSFDGTGRIFHFVDRKSMEEAYASPGRAEIDTMALSYGFLPEGVHEVSQAYPRPLNELVLETCVDGHTIQDVIEMERNVERLAANSGPITLDDHTKAVDQDRVAYIRYRALAICTTKPQTGVFVMPSGAELEVELICGSDAIDFDDLQVPIATGIGTVDHLQGVCNRANEAIRIHSVPKDHSVVAVLRGDPALMAADGTLPPAEHLISLEIAGVPVYTFDPAVANDAAVVEMDAVMLARAISKAYAQGQEDGRQFGEQRVRGLLRDAMGII